jgi:hypothetical protein
MLRQGFEPQSENTGKTADSKAGRPTGRPKTQEVDLLAIAAALQALPREALAAVLLNVVQSQAAK